MSQRRLTYQQILDSDYAESGDMWMLPRDELDEMPSSPQSHPQPGSPPTPPDHPPSQAITPIILVPTAFLSVVTPPTNIDHADAHALQVTLTESLVVTLEPIELHTSPHSNIESPVVEVPLTVSTTESLVVIPEPIEPHAAPCSNKSGGVVSNKHEKKCIECKVFELIKIDEKKLQNAKNVPRNTKFP